MELAASKGLIFVDWDLILNEENLAESGTYKLQIKGDEFSDEKEF